MGAQWAVGEEGVRGAGRADPLAAAHGQGARCRRRRSAGCSSQLQAQLAVTVIEVICGCVDVGQIGRAGHEQREHSEPCYEGP